MPLLEFDDLDWTSCCNICGCGRDQDDLRIYKGVIYCKECWNKTKRINYIQYNDKNTIVFNPCWRMKIIKGIGTCEGVDDCENLAYIIRGVYFDCLYGE